MSFFVVDISGASRDNSVQTMIIEADSLAIAKVLAGVQFDGDSPWADGAEIVTASADFEGWSFRVRVGNSPDGYVADGPLPVVDVEYIGVASDTADLVGAELKDLLNATDPIITSADYNTSTNVLLIADGATDALGKRTIEVIITPPGGKGPVNAMRTTLVHQGAADTDDLSCVLVQPTKVPKVLKTI
jgi:hypothetical protein